MREKNPLGLFVGVVLEKISKAIDKIRESEEEALNTTGWKLFLTKKKSNDFSF